VAAIITEHPCGNAFAERLLDSLRVHDAEFEESDDEGDVEGQRTGRASQKRARLEAEESAPNLSAIGDPKEPVETAGEAVTQTANAATAPPLPPSTSVPPSPTLEHAQLPTSVQQPPANGSNGGAGNLSANGQT
jgi:hypothetical protein